MALTDNIEYRRVCKNCSSYFFAYPSDKKECCSRSCWKESIRTERICKKCGVGFSILKSLLETNASGNFCSTNCYYSYLRGIHNKDVVVGNKIKYRRSFASAKLKLKSNGIQVCCICGTMRKVLNKHGKEEWTLVTVESNECWSCGTIGNTNHHHAIPQSMRPKQNVVVPLCVPCHTKLHNQDKYSMVKYITKLFRQTQSVISKLTESIRGNK